MGTCIVGGMSKGAARKSDPELSVRLHDAVTGFSVGLALLRGAVDGNASQAVQILDESLARLKGLSQGLAGASNPSSPPAHLESALLREAELLGLHLDLELIGRTAWLPPNQSELLHLVIREALRNTRRHSGTRRCRVKLDLSTCPFVVQVRDWGSGLLFGARPASGIALLQSLAAEMGCRLTMGSQPGLGTDLFLVGPACACGGKATPTEVREQFAARSQDPEKTPQDANKTPADAKLLTSKSRLVR